MALSEPQLIQLELEAKELLARTKIMDKSFTIIAERITFLGKVGARLEIIFLYAQAIEHYLKLLIEGYASRRRILHLLGERDLFESVKLVYEEEELGHLIGILRQFRADPELLKKLNRFNQLRKEAIHHIFDGRREIPAIEKEIMDYLASDDSKTLISAIGEEQKKNRDEIVKILKSQDGAARLAGIEPTKAA
jgi:hypothetical protein